MGFNFNKKKKSIIAGSVSGLLVIIVVAIAIVTSKNAPKADDNKIEKNLKAVCAPTDYKETCFNSLMKAEPKSTEPLDLIKLSFNVTIKSINESLKKASEDVKSKADKDPQAKDAFELCEKLMIDAIDGLKKCIDYGFSVDKVDVFVEDLRVWLSGSIAFQQTCMDSFEEIKSNLVQDMVNIFKTARELNSNSLAMVTEIATLLPNLNITGLTGNLESYARRRLMSTEDDSIPTWVGPEARQLMALTVEEGPGPIKANAVVALDGSGQFKTINDALKQVPVGNTAPFVIHIKEGFYKEKILITRKTPYVTLIGDGPTKTVITGSQNLAIGKVKTFVSGTVIIEGEHFVAKDIGIENTAGPDGGQAVALRVSADYAVFHNCQLDGYQDTLYVHSQRQFYRDCTVSGTVDFIFGDAKCILQNCKILVRKPNQGQGCIVTAQGRSDVREPTGLVLEGCHILGDPEYIPVKSVTRSFLGRPWKEYSRTIIMKTIIEDVIDPEGWSPMVGDFALNTLFYAEHLNTGPGSNTAQRVKWPGIRKLTPEEVLMFTGDKFLLGNTWIPQTQVPYSGTIVNS